MSYTQIQKQHQQELAEAREKIKQRKARTRRLIQFGAIAEHYVDNASSMTPEEFQKALENRISPSGGRNQR